MKKSVFSMILVLLLCLSLGVNAGAVNRAVWQDPGSAVLLWDNSENPEYNVFRSDSPNGDYEYIGSSNSGSFRDDTAKYPNKYYYKLQKSDAANNDTSLLEPFSPVVSPEDISSVYVIMYHNFISDEDIKNGVEFEEYSISPKDFEEDLIWLKNNGWITVTSDDLLRHLEGKKSLPQKAVIISIDDGTWGVYTNAWPLLKKYNMCADFNIIGARIDAAWDDFYAGKTRDNDPAPYCTWEELAEMQRSGEINICSHTYGLHVYGTGGRVGMRMNENESAEAFAEVVKKDYDLAVQCINGWTGKTPETVAYPYSERSAEGDKIILENTGYKILMAGAGARGTLGNYFVKGADISSQSMLISRSCRMNGTPIGAYLEEITETDNKNGINTQPDLIHAKNTDEIAKDYQNFTDVRGEAWFSGSVYYSYLNGLMRGVSESEFAPDANISRAMAVTLLCRLAKDPDPKSAGKFTDSNGSEWWFRSAAWADEAGILSSFEDGSFRPDDPISREELAASMYNCAKFLNLDTSKRADIEKFTDSQNISREYKEAVSWAASYGIFNGNADGSFAPAGSVTRAQMSMILRNWLCR
ncbi:MAG: S-layer homology domain-containing protein [Clostridia bacterium]|nr:S-layer homology domain-containing protein [Clostridia bacterium]